MKMHIEERKLVLPGQLIAEGDFKIGEGVFREGDEIRSSQLGLVDKRGDRVRTIPLEGRYIPKEGDRVLGVAVDSYYAGWILDINSPYEGNLSVSSLVQRRVDLNEEDIDEFLDIGNIVEAKVQEVDELMDVKLEVSDSERGRLSGGRLVEIAPSRIPRVIGRKGSMISTLEESGNCDLSVGQNGRIMIRGDNKEQVNRVVEAVLMIEREAHTSGLTDRVKEFLEKESKGG